MKKYFVTVNGALSDELIKTGNVKLEKKDSKTDKVLFLSFSNCDIPLKSKFNYILINEEKYSIRATVEYVTQSYNLPFDCIPNGHKTICVFNFEEDYDLLLLIPFTEKWYRSGFNCEIGFEE